MAFSSLQAHHCCRLCEYLIQCVRRSKSIEIVACYFAPQMNVVDHAINFKYRRCVNSWRTSEGWIMDHNSHWLSVRICSASHKIAASLIVVTDNKTLKYSKKKKKILHVNVSVVRQHSFECESVKKHTQILCFYSWSLMHEFSRSIFYIEETTWVGFSRILKSIAMRLR